MQGLALARTGRHRRQVRRQPNGQPSRPAIDYRKLASEQPHRRWLPADVRLDQKADTTLGALVLIGAVTVDQGLAGDAYAAAVGRYRSVVQPPRGLAGRGRGFDCNPQLCMRETDYPCECRQRKSRYDELYEVLAKVGRKPLMAVNRVVVFQQRVTRSEMDHLRIGLSALARHMGLTRDRKSNSAINAH